MVITSVSPKSSWIGISSYNTEITFDEQIQEALDVLLKAPGVDESVARNLIDGGFHSLAGLAAATSDDFSEIESVDDELATSIIEYAQSRLQ